MSVVIRMEMPKCCDDCDANYDCCACGIIGAFWFHNPRYKEFDSSKERLPDCPIIGELPEVHGRLVDAEILRVKLIEHIGETNGFGKAFDETPTVVEKE